MENQHRKIKGYRELTQQEIDLMNEIKVKGEELKALCNKVDTFLEVQREDAKRELQSRNSINGFETPENIDPDLVRIASAQPGRWLSIARTDLQTGLMALVRAVAQPESF